MGDILLMEVVGSAEILDIGHNKGDELTTRSMCQTTKFTTSIRNIGQLGFQIQQQQQQSKNKNKIKFHAIHQLEFCEFDQSEGKVDMTLYHVTSRKKYPMCKSDFVCKSI
jgi:hypothetical protein